MTTTLDAIWDEVSLEMFDASSLKITIR